MPSSSSCSLSCLRRAIGPSVGFLSLAFLGRFGLGGCGLRSATVFLSALFGLLFRAPLAAFGDLLALALDKRYRIADGHFLALVCDQLCERPFILGLELHRDFVGLDLCYGVSLGDLFALALEPLEEGALLHRVAHLGHNDFRHLTSPPRTEPGGPRWRLVSRWGRPSTPSCAR